MLEFCPLPTNLNQVGGSIYALQQNHGGARFLDHPNAMNTHINNINNNNNNNNTINNNIINNCMTSTASLTAQALGASAATITSATTTAIGTPATPIGGNLTCSTVAITPLSTTTNLHHQHHQQHHLHHNSNHNNNNNNGISCPTTNSLTAASPPQNPNNVVATSSSSSSLAVAAAAAAAAAAAGSSLTLTSSASSSSTSSIIAIGPTVASVTSTSLSSSSSSSSSSLLSSSSTTTGAGAGVAATSTKLSALDQSAVCHSGRSELIGHIKCEKNFEICEGCGQKIHDRYLMNVSDSSWHESCLACCYCGMQLQHTNSCYVRNGKIYCKLDYDRLFGIKCAACCHPILPQELVMRPVPNFIFHLPCFVCYACRMPLQKGEQFMLRDGQLFCYRHDLEKELYLAAAHCGFVGLDEDDLMRPRDGRRGPKRPRTILTSQQRKQFKASFDQSPKPCRKVREALAKDTGLSVRVVQVWFQNQRAKMKKIQRKAKNGAKNGGGGGGGSAASGDDKDQDKMDEKSIKQELGTGGSGGIGNDGGYLGMDSAFASQPLNPNLPFSPDDYPANSNDSFCSSDLSLDGSNFDQLDDDADSLSLNNLELQSSSSSGNQHSNPHDMLANINTSLINPIDKLYLMQNSYFNVEH